MPILARMILCDWKIRTIENKLELESAFSFIPLDV